MFDNLSNKLGAVFDRLTGRGALNEADVNEALREVRVALLEADVALPVVKDFVEKIRTRAVGEDVTRSVTPGQQVIKIVHDNLVELLGKEAVPLSIGVAPPAIIMMLGLQGSGKTTTAAKLAKRLNEVERKKSFARFARRTTPGGAGTACRAWWPDWRCDVADCNGAGTCRYCETRG